ncbi:MAG: TetR/AcrR family transcriptional regulator [Gordonia amarae]
MTSSGDPATVDQLLTLLWRGKLGGRQGKRGPRQRIAVDDVVRAGIEVATESGLAALSVRKVADKLGVGAMSIYTYVPSKAELVGLMVDAVLGEGGLPAHAESLRDRVFAVGMQIWEERLRHPWLLQAQTARPLIGPRAMALYEWQLSAIDGMGFTDVEMDQAVTMIVGAAESAARTAVELDRARNESGMSDLEWWQINEPVLSKLYSAEDFPIAARVGTSVGQEYQSIADPERALTFALDRIVAGLQDLLGTRPR